jgi:ribosomal-protein-alanine N-acetyltransferase
MHGSSLRIERLQEAFTMRKFAINDLQSVIRINRIALPENYTDYFFIDIFQRFPETFIVAELEGKVVGYIMCRIETGLSNFGFGGLIRKGHVISVAVLPEYRRKGIGEALVKEATNGMLRYNAKQCYLEVRVTNSEAISLYKKLGFEVVRTSHGYYADGESAYIMTKKL